MESIEKLRIQINGAYNAKIYQLIGSVICCVACKMLLASSFFEPLTAWVFAVALGILFYFKPTFAVLFNGIILFLSLAHINAFAVLLLIIVSFFLCNSGAFAAFAAIVLPLTLLPNNVFSGYQFLVLLFCVFFVAKKESLFKSTVVTIYYSILALMTMNCGFANYLYKNPFKLQTSKAGDIGKYLDKIDFSKVFDRFASHDITILIIVIAIYALLGILAYYIFNKNLIGGRTVAKDATELLSFVVMIALTVAVTYAGSMIFKTEYQLPIGAIALQGLIAYVISRPFALDEVDGEVAFDNWDSIIGYEDTKKEIQNIIKPYTSKKEYDKLVKAGMKPVKGLLLFGPPGTGKTTIARAIANEAKMKLIVVNASSFVSKYVGESEQNLVKLFDSARKKAPCIICFDEIESFLIDRSKAERHYEMSLVSTFLTQMDGFVDLQDVFVIATTNNPTLIDPAAMRPGRFDKLIFVGAPDINARANMFKKFLEGKALNADYDKLAENSERFTGADIKVFCENVFRENDYKKVSEEELLDRLSNTRPAYSIEMKKAYDLWAKKYNRSFEEQNDNKKKETKKLSWDDIKGMDDIKKILKDKIETPIENAEKFKKYGIPVSNGILFFGPPGCGKTFFAKVVADESNANFFAINGPELLGKGVGESEENLRKAFNDARELKPAILFFDEIDAIAESREGNMGSVRLINQLLTEMDGMETLSGVTVIAATNRPENLDSALMRAGRFDTKIYIPLPDKDSIEQLMISSMDKVPCEADFEKLATKLEGYTCADIVAICNKAKTEYVKREIAGDTTPLKLQNFESIISSIKPSLSAKDIEKYNKQKKLQSLL